MGTRQQWHVLGRETQPRQVEAPTEMAPPTASYNTVLLHPAHRMCFRVNPSNLWGRQNRPAQASGPCPAVHPHDLVSQTVQSLLPEEKASRKTQVQPSHKRYKIRPRSSLERSGRTITLGGLQAISANASVNVVHCGTQNARTAP